jgi:hypothetical protein
VNLSSAGFPGDGLAPVRFCSALDSQDFEQAASLRDRERQLLAGKTARQHQWEAAHPDLASLAEQVQRLSGEMERLRDLLRQHGRDRPSPLVGRCSHPNMCAWMAAFRL